MLTYKALKELAASLGHSLSPTGGPQYRLPDMIRAQRSRLPYLVLPAEDVVNAIRWNLAWGSGFAANPLPQPRVPVQEPGRATPASGVCLALHHIFFDRTTKARLSRAAHVG